jgi:hypothetical protein
MWLRSLHTEAVAMQGDEMQVVVEELRETLPPVFAGSSLGKLTGDAINWPTIQNKRALREIPDECFIRSRAGGRGPGRILVRRDPFLDWWRTTLLDARQPLAHPPPRRGRAARTAAEPVAEPAPEAAPPTARTAKPATRSPTRRRSATAQASPVAKEAISS